jgi:hypothetical protein
MRQGTFAREMKCREHVSLRYDFPMHASVGRTERGKLRKKNKLLNPALVPTVPNFPRSSLDEAGNFVAPLVPQTFVRRPSSGSPLNSAPAVGEGKRVWENELTPLEPNLHRGGRRCAKAPCRSRQVSTCCEGQCCHRNPLMMTR